MKKTSVAAKKLPIQIADASDGGGGGGGGSDDPGKMLDEWIRGWSKSLPHCMARYRGYYWNKLFALGELELLPLLVNKIKEDPREHYPLILLYDQKVLSGDKSRKSLCVLSSQFDPTQYREGGDLSRAQRLVRMWDSGHVQVCKSCGRYYHMHESFDSRETMGRCVKCFFT